MRPRSTTRNATDGLWSNVKTQGYLFLPNTFCSHLTNFEYVFVAEFGVRMSFALFSAVCGKTHHSLCPCIRHVIGMCAEEEVVRVDASTIISPRAIMANLHPFWNRPVVQYPGHAVGIPVFFAIMENPVSVSMSPANPYPASVRTILVNSFPESFFQRAKLNIHAGARNVPVKKSSGVSLHVPTISTVLWRNLRGLATPALTLAIRRAQSVLSNPRGVISYVLREGWNRIIHVNSPFSTLTKPGIVTSNRLALLLLSWTCIVAQMSHFLQGSAP